jgi:hypothetical protein
VRGPIDTGSAARPNQKTLSAHSWSVEAVSFVPNATARTTLTMVTTAPLASHFSCWRRSPEERRNLSTWRKMKPSDNTRVTTRIECSAIANQPAGLSTAESPPTASMRRGWAPRAPATATATTASSARYSAQKVRSPQRQNRDASLPSGKSRITATDRTKAGAHN